MNSNFGWLVETLIECYFEYLCDRVCIKLGAKMLYYNA